MRRPSTRKAQRGSSVASAYSLPAPTGGLNKRDSIATMAETDAIDMTNIFPEPTDVRTRRGTEYHATDFPGVVESVMPYNAAGGTQTLFAASNNQIWDATNKATVDALKLYILEGNALDAVYEYDIATAGDISTASSSAKNFSVRSVDGSPADIFFKSDGTKVYIIGATRTVSQFSLSTAWDISTASYDSVSLSVAAQESLPNSISFKSDGTELYIVGEGNDTVYQYTLTTGWDISTASYSGKSFPVSSQSTYPQGIFFKSDGTSMYVLDLGPGAVAAKVYQYTLSSAWDVSTASYAAKSFSVNSQEPSPRAVFFKSDGTSMYVYGGQYEKVFQYTLSSAWDVSTASYASKSLDSSTEENQGHGLAFKSDGTELYIVGQANDTIYQYTLTSGWDVSTGAYAVKKASVASQDAAPKAAFFRPNGLAMYVSGTTGTSVYQYTLTNPWDITSASYASKSADTSGETSKPTGLFLKPDGLAMYVLADEIANTYVYQYTLSTAWDVSTASYASKVDDITAQVSSPGDIRFSDDGAAMYVADQLTGVIYQYTLSTPWDVSTSSYASKSLDVTGQSTGAIGLEISKDGTKVYVLAYGNDAIYQYTLGTAWDLSTGSYASKSFDVSALSAQSSSIFIKAEDYVQSSLTNNRWQHCNFSLSDGTSYLCCFNGADSPRYWDNTNWTAITGASSPAITGITTTDIIAGFVHKRRLYLVLNNSMSVYYLPVDSVGGAASPIDLGGIANLGGYVVAGETWTLDAGAGLDDYWACITSEGQLVVYEGTDPSSSSTWQLKGVWSVGEPIGRRCMYKYQGDLLIITTAGIVSAGRVLLSGRVDDQVKITDKISGAVSADTSLYKGNFGWQLQFFPEQDMLILNIPVTEGSSYKQYAMNTITGAWGGPFSGVVSACWAIWDEKVYFGTASSVDRFWVNKDDNGSAISFYVQQAYSSLGARGSLKQVKAVRSFIESDGAFSMNVAINVDYSVDDVAGSVNSGELRFSDWDAVGGIGSSISVVYKGELNGTDFRLQASDIVYEKGGIIG